MTATTKIAPEPLTPKQIEWLEETRKIPAETAAANGVVSMNGRIAFEYRKNGEIQYVKSRIVDRSGEKSFVRDRKGARSCLWGVDTLIDRSSDETVIITEGEFDRLACLASGIGPVVSVPDGARQKNPGTGAIDPLTDPCYDYLWDSEGNLIEGLRDAKRIILAVDDDESGRILRDELAVRLGRDRCYWPTYPEGCKDANEVLIQHGATELYNAIYGARAIVPDRLVKLSALAGLHKPEILSSGLPVLERHLTLVAPELLIVSGPPNHGKSQVLTWLLVQIAAVNEAKVAYLQFEDSPERTINDVCKLIIAHPAIEAKTRSEALAWADDHFLAIAPDERDGDIDMTIAWLESMITEAAVRQNCKIVALDPWNELEHIFERSDTTATYLNRGVKRLKRLARRLRIALAAVVHPDKASGISNTTIEQWSLYNLDGGAVWNNKADHGLIVLRDEKDESITHLKVCKSKDWGVMGRPGIVRTKFNAGTAGFQLISN